MRTARKNSFKLFSTRSQTHWDDYLLLLYLAPRSLHKSWWQMWNPRNWRNMQYVKKLAWAVKVDSYGFVSLTEKGLDYVIEHKLKDLNKFDLFSWIRNESSLAALKLKYNGGPFAGLSNFDTIILASKEPRLKAIFTNYDWVEPGKRLDNREAELVNTYNKVLAFLDYCAYDIFEKALKGMWTQRLYPKKYVSKIEKLLLKHGVHTKKQRVLA